MPETIALVAADGSTTTMSGSGTTANAVMLGIEGLFSPPFDIIGDEVPLEAGERVDLVRAERRTLTLPFRIYAADEGALRTAVREWVSRLNPLNGDAAIRWTGPDLQSRDLHVRLQAGTEGEVSADTSGFNRWFQTLALSFRASDPWWYDTSVTTQTFVAADPVVFFPIFPLSLSSSEVFAESAVNNDGDTFTWPTFTITGPGSSPVLRNVTTGRILDLTGVTLSAGESIEIDTNPGVKTVVKNDGTNLFSSLSSSSSLWRLELGLNTVRLEMGGADENSQLDVAYRRRWLSV